jgi:pyruvate ferredoxin oxidoreductase gamma subunit
MKNLLEIRIHGRGGQGNVVAAYLLASVAIEEGYYGQAFPSFGAERRGAPVVAFVRMSDVPVKRRCQVLHPSYLIVQDQALLQVPGVLLGLSEHGRILVNSTRSSEDLQQQLGVEVLALPAAQTAARFLGRPLPNTALVAAFLTLTGICSIQALNNALAERFAGKVLEKNLALVEEIPNQVPANQWKESIHAANS